MVPHEGHIRIAALDTLSAQGGRGVVQAVCHATSSSGFDRKEDVLTKHLFFAPAEVS